MRQLLILLFIIGWGSCYCQPITVADLINIKNSDIGEIQEILEGKRFELDHINTDSVDFKDYLFSNEKPYYISLLIYHNETNPRMMLMSIKQSDLVNVRASLIKNDFVKGESYSINQIIYIEYDSPRYKVKIFNSPEEFRDEDDKIRLTGKREYTVYLGNKDDR